MTEETTIQKGRSVVFGLAGVGRRLVDLPAGVTEIRLEMRAGCPAEIQLMINGKWTDKHVLEPVGEDAMKPSDLRWSRPTGINAFWRRRLAAEALGLEEKS